MRVFILALTLTSCSTVAAQLFQGLFDYGGGLDLFMSPGYNEGPCIHRTRRRRRRRRRTTAKPAASVVLTPNAAPNNGFRPVVGGANNDPMLADPFYGGLDFMFGGGFFDPIISNPAPVKPPKAKQPNSFRQKSQIASANQQQNIGPKGLAIDYSKLTNTELKNLLEIAERQARIDIKVGNTQSAQSAAPAPAAVNLANNAQVPKMSYSELSSHLKDLQRLAQEQINNRISPQNANVDGTAQAKSNRNINAAANHFRSMGVLARKRRAMRHHVSKRQMFPFDFMDMFRGTGMGTGSAVPAPMNMGFCQCMQRSEVENGYMIQSSSKYKCNRGLVCACHAGGLYRRKKK